MPRQLRNITTEPWHMQLAKKQFGPAWWIELKNNLNIYIPFIIELYNDISSHNRAVDFVLMYIVKFQVNRVGPRMPTINNPNVSYIVDFVL